MRFLDRLRGYVVELIQQDGRVRAYAKGKDWDAQLVVDRRLQALEAGSWRYQRELRVPPSWINLVRLPPEYGYGAYHLRLPTRRRYGRTVPVNVGPNIQLTLCPPACPPAFCVYYFNPNPVERRLTLSLDLFPIVLAPQGIPLYEIWGELDAASREECWGETPVYEVICRALADFENAEIPKVSVNVELPVDIDDAFYLFTAKFPQLRRVLSRVGVEVHPAEAGRHPYKAVNPKNGRTADIPRHGGREMGPGLVAKICRELGLDRQEVLRAAGRRR